MLRIILTRHGRTVENDASILQGHFPGKLSEEGKQQATKVAERLRSTHFDMIYSSDLARSADTAKAIATYHPATPLRYTSSLRERDFGAYNGKAKSDLRYSDPHGIDRLREAEDCESYEQVLHRAQSFLEEMYAKHARETILLVTHSTMGKAIVSQIRGVVEVDWDTNLRLDNTSVNIFDISEDGGSVEVDFNNIKHLE